MGLASYVASERIQSNKNKKRLSLGRDLNLHASGHELISNSGDQEEMSLEGMLFP